MTNDFLSKCKEFHNCFINKIMLPLVLMANPIIHCPHCPSWSHSRWLLLVSLLLLEMSQSERVEMPQGTAYDKAATT